MRRCLMRLFLSPPRKDDGHRNLCPRSERWSNPSWTQTSFPNTSRATIRPARHRGLLFFLFLTGPRSLGGGDDLFRLKLGDVIVVVELHAERGAALRHGSEIV